MLPGVSDEQLIQSTRNKVDVPIIIISAKSALEDKVNLLNIGDDDYITKLFQCEELITRVNSHLRSNRKVQMQGKEKECKIYRFKELTLEGESREVIVKERNIALTSHEFEILTILIKNPDKVYSREVLYEEVWKNGYYDEDIDLYIRYLSNK